MLAVARYTTNGTLDSTFGDGGVTEVGFEVPVTATAMRLDSEGRAIVYSLEFGSIHLARIEPDGSIDRDFGRIKADLEHPFARGGGVVLGSDDKIVLVGTTPRIASADNDGHLAL